MITVRLNNIDVIYLSYDEPCADDMWQDLRQKAPWAKRVHGVKGFDACHIACADLAKTDYLITIDADNIVDPEFFELTMSIKEKDAYGAWCWSGRNVINNLSYGNGGVKVWHKNFIYNMNTHERSPIGETGVDFCWKDNYFSEDAIYSEVHSNWSPYQTYRAGFREGVKMALDRGKRIDIKDMDLYLTGDNLTRLVTWMNIGMDANNGIWAMYGARMGFNLVVNSNTDLNVISDYDWFLTHWNEIWNKYKNGVTGVCIKSGNKWDDQLLLSDFKNIGNILTRLGFNKLATLDAKASRLIKDLYLC